MSVYHPITNSKIPVVCRATFSGYTPKKQFYIVLEQIDRMKKDGFKMETHERSDTYTHVTYNYVLVLYQQIHE